MNLGNIKCTSLKIKCTILCPGQLLKNLKERSLGLFIHWRVNALR